MGVLRKSLDDTMNRTKNSLLSTDMIRAAASSPNCVFLENTKPDSENQQSYLFLNPVEVIRTNSLDEVLPSLQRLNKACGEGYYVAGFISYETGKVFEESLAREIKTEAPYLWFGVYDDPIIFDHRSNKFIGKSSRDFLGSSPSLQTGRILTVHPALEKSEYVRVIERIKTYIRDGDTYQVNFTFKIKLSYSGNPADIYCNLRNSQHVPYGAFLRLGEWSILSFSPELFFRIDRNSISLRPMKGTIKRGRTNEEDARLVESLKKSEKNRAENLMIVDLLRNDVGKIAKTGTVKVSSLFDVEKYDTVFQATSTIQAKLRKEWNVLDVVSALFPSGSVTGAPKIRTMQIIQELERGTRGVYTGAIGFFAPKRKAIFNVAIRTLVLHGESKTGEMGVGSGFVHDSVPEDEYRECLLKAKFLTEASEDFLLFETVRWDPQKRWPLLRLHLRRLRESARYFDFRYCSSKIHEALRTCERKLRKSAGSPVQRIKLTLGRNGDVVVHSSPLSPLTGPQFAAISEQRTHSADRFLFHKTTHRKPYDDATRDAVSRGLFDFIFLNENEQVTEGARSNVVIRKHEEYFTPPLECGVLPGIYRTSLFRRKGMNLKEKIITEDDLHTADEILLCNALRGLFSVKLVDIYEPATEKTNAQLLAVED